MRRIYKLLLWLVIIPWIFYTVFFALWVYGGDTTSGWIVTQSFPRRPDPRACLEMYLLGLTFIMPTLPFGFMFVLLRGGPCELAFVLSLLDFTAWAVGALLITVTPRRLLSFIRRASARPRRRFKTAVAATMLVLVLCCLFVFWRFWWAQPEPWLFVGAYATYEGNTTMDSFDVQATARFELVEHNSTHGKLLFVFTATSSLTPPLRNQTTVWVDIRDKSLDIPCATRISNYEKDTYFEGFGRRRCVIANYSVYDPAISFEMTVFIDKETGWPMRMDYDYSQPTSWSLDLRIVDTNIRELIPPL